MGGLLTCFALYQPVSFPKMRTPPLEWLGRDEQVRLSLLEFGEGQRDEARARGCPRLPGSPASLPSAFVSQPRPAGSRKQEEGGRPVSRNNGAGQSRY